MAKKKKKAQGTTAGEAMLSAIQAFNTAREIQAEEALTELVSNVVEAVVASPVVETPQSETVTKTEVKKIVEEVISSPAGEKMLAAIQEFNAPRETVATPAQTETSKATAPYYDINKGMMVNPDGTAYVAPKPAPTPSAAPATPEDVGLVLGAGKSGITPEPKTPAELAGLQFGVGAGPKPKTPAELAGLQFGVGGPGVITGDKTFVGTTAVSPEAGNAGLFFGAGAPGSITGPGGDTGTRPTTTGVITTGGTTTGGTTTGGTTTGGTTTGPTTTGGTTTGGTTTGATTGGAGIGTPARPTGTPPAFIYDSASGTWIRPPYPSDGKRYTWDDAAGWVDVDVRPGPTGTTLTDNTRNLAVNTFKNTLALLFGAKEANEPWMDELYNVVSSYYKTGSTVEEATNLALRDARNNPKLAKFTDRFKAIFALEDMVRAGRPVYVPTIAEYVATEEKIADVFARAGLPDLANREILSQVIGTGKSVTETVSIITDVFNTIDNAPAAWKAEVYKQFPGATRTMLAKGLLLGEKGAQELEKEVQGLGVVAAAGQQGLTISQERGQDIFAQGYGYTQAGQRFAQVARILPEAQKLSAISRREPITQAEVERSQIEGIASEQLKLERLAQEEISRFSGRTGMSRVGLTSQTRGQF